tara:strand:- start:851 stop:1432 length:582 start_codon:yes stop_codon:yes gene_type:complete
MAKPKKKKNAYAICTAQKKKSDMGHDAWKRCVDNIKNEESTMKFFEKLIMLEKRRIRGEGAAPFSNPAPFSTAGGGDDDKKDKKKGEEDDDKKDTSPEEKAEEMKNDLPSSPPKPNPPSKSRNAAEADLDDEDTDLPEEKDWIQKAVNPKHKGYCTPMTKKTCTPARKALAKRFKKAGRKEKKQGGTGWQGKV